VDSIVRQVSVEQDDAGSVVVEWTLTGTPCDLDIAVGATPNFSDHVHVCSVRAGETSVRFEGHDHSRMYVSIRAHGGDVVVAAARRVAFEGVQNFRDLGGYPTSDGGHTVWGQIYRADSLHKLTEQDLVAFGHLGIRRVYDLRSDAERESHPNPFDSLQYAVIGQPADRDRRAIDPDLFRAAGDGEDLLHTLYLGMLEHSASLLGEVLSGLARADHRPAVFHCHAGKDRTGVVAALVLLVAGVDRDLILDDYELTRRYRTPDHQRDSLDNLLAHGMSPEAAAGVLAAPRWAMEGALDAIESTYGGIRPYLVELAGMQPDVVDELRRVIVVPRR
jgi:protein-tyrosine phosphatase